MDKPSRLVNSGGLFKQLIVATLLFDNGSLEVFSSLKLLRSDYGGHVWLLHQLYCDFSGYTDLARGSALLLGFDRQFQSALLRNQRW